MYGITENFVCYSQNLYTVCVHFYFLLVRETHTPLALPHVNFIEGGQHSGCVLGLLESGRNRLPHLGHLDASLSSSARDLSGIRSAHGRLQWGHWHLRDLRDAGRGFRDLWHFG